MHARRMRKKDKLTLLSLPGNEVKDGFVNPFITAAVEHYFDVPYSHDVANGPMLFLRQNGYELDVMRFKKTTLITKHL